MVAQRNHHYISLQNMVVLKGTNSEWQKVISMEYLVPVKVYTIEALELILEEHRIKLAC